MTKLEFLDELARELGNLSPKDRQDSIDYYREMIDDRVESGMSEAEAVADLGAPQAVAHDILLDTPLPALIKTKCKKKTAWRVWEIILLALGSPIWLSLAVVALSVILVVYAVLWAVIAVLWAADVSLLAIGVVAVGTFGMAVVAAPMSALLYAGMGLAALGLTILLFFGCLKLTILFAKLSVAILRWIKSLIIGKEKKR